VGWELQLLMWSLWYHSKVREAVMVRNWVKMEY
jgi:hypothetical protein